MSGLLKLVLSSVAVIVLACAAAVFLVPPVPPGRGARREAEARHLLGAMAEALWAYHRDRGEFPPGDGSGSAGLARALAGPSREGIPYLVFPPEGLTPAGDIRNPAATGDSVFYYRLKRNLAASEGTGSQGWGYDLWWISPGGVEIGLSDWVPAVSPP